jgi:hypothetical protein
VLHVGADEHIERHPSRSAVVATLGTRPRHVEAALPDVGDKHWRVDRDSQPCRTLIDYELISAMALTSSGSADLLGFHSDRLALRVVAVETTIPGGRRGYWPEGGAHPYANAC